MNMIVPHAPRLEDRIERNELTFILLFRGRLFNLIGHLVTSRYHYTACYSNTTSIDDRLPAVTHHFTCLLIEHNVDLPLWADG